MPKGKQQLWKIHFAWRRGNLTNKIWLTGIVKILSIWKRVINTIKKWWHHPLWKGGQSFHIRCSVYGENEGLRPCFMPRFGALQSGLSHSCAPLSNPQACQTLFPKGSPRWHSYVCVCVRFLFPCTRLWGRGVTWRLIPRGCHDNYSCQAVIKDTTLILGLWHQLVPPATYDLYTHTHAPIYLHIHTQPKKTQHRVYSIYVSLCACMARSYSACITCVYVTKVYSGYQASLEPGVCFSSGWKRGSLKISW